MDDLISRQAAIDALIAEGRNVDSRYLESERIIHESDAVEVISMLPSAQPERKMGEWEHLWDAPDGTYIGRCAKCGFVHVFIDGNDAQYKYCPNCGTDMRGGQDG